MTQEKDFVRRLRRLDCCALSDAIDKVGLGSVVTGVPQQAGDKRVAGRIVTIKLGTGAPPSGTPRHLGTTAIELGTSDNVIVVEQRSGVEAGSWGGLLSLGAKVKGIAGVIADGPVRDIDEAREMGFPVFTSALTARTARGRIVEKGTNVPIEAFGVAIEPGDYVAADRSALIFIRAADIETVLTAAEAIVAREAHMAKAVLAGVPMSEVMGGNYEFMLKD
ncbi:RraA family protein [Pandoraea oxalativorans]|uniref:Putative 4-hydroxy-4-methyl-2-oxoglutarate aldolase n=1 Tax=Pandoraea oxalativorans TaxID=573737 RepID=A0A0E3U6E9_9BURK|nr:dimethylmenaquinone methyltransferase [Pandoraea oxalativorans]AKC69443.1 dimethylmenaquinone methyltransferase [Pandoraea oxalativorans]